MSAPAPAALQNLRFRSYRPRDEGLEKYCEEVGDASAVIGEVAAEWDGVLSAASAKFGSESLVADNIVPKKANWELKRALRPRLERLERRTERALAALAREGAPKDGAAGGEHLARTVAAAKLVDEDQDE